MKRRTVADAADRLRLLHRQAPDVPEVAPVANVRHRRGERSSTRHRQVPQRVLELMRAQRAVGLQGAPTAIRQRVPEPEQPAVRHPDRRMRPPQQPGAALELPRDLDRERDLVDQVAVRAKPPALSAAPRRPRGSPRRPGRTSPASPTATRAAPPADPWSRRGPRARTPDTAACGSRPGARRLRPPERRVISPCSPVAA